MRRKFTIKFILLVFTFYILHFTFYIPAAFAADSTPSADADTKSKVEELIKEIASRAAKIKQEVNRKLKDKAYVGTIQAKSETSITLATSSGPKMVSINQDTVFESKKGAVSKNKRSIVTVDSINQDDYVAALGDNDETGVLITRKIILLPTPDSELKTFLWGQIISRSDNAFNIKDTGFKNVPATLPTSPKVNLNDIVILTGSKNEEEIFEAEFVHVIPRGEILKPKKVATPSAVTSPHGEQIATPSAKLKPITR